MRKVLVSILITALLFSLAAIPMTVATTISDISGHWAEQAISALLDKNYISGYPDGTFKPDNPVTRAEFLKILTSVLNISPSTGGTSQFSDVSTDDWFFGYVVAAVEKGIVSGYPDGTFKPNNPITRQEAAKIIVKASGIDETLVDAKGALFGIKDAGEIAEWANAFVATALDKGLMKGDPSGAFRPDASITRAETATIGYRLIPVAVAGTFIFGRGADSVKLDPADVTDGESARATVQIYDTLVMFRGETTLIKPGLATSWDVSQDNLTWIFHLRQGVKFHDGSDFNADAVLFNFERWWDKDNPYHKGTFEYWESMFGGFKGDEGCVIQSFEKVDDYTFKIVLKQPFAPLLSNLAMFCFAIASPSAIKDQTPENYATSTQYPPIGTGPFKFVEWTKDDKIVLERNPDYWGETAKLEKVILKTVPDNSARYLALKSGEIHGMEGANPDDVTAAKNDPNLQVLLRPAMNVGTVIFNVTAEPFNNVNVRKAIAMAIDKKAVVAAFYGETGLVANQFLPPSMWGYNDKLEDYPYDPEGAKALLAKAGFPDGFETDFWYMPNPRPYYPDPKGIAEAIAADLAKVGVRCNLKTEDWTTYLADRRDGKFNLWMLGWTGDNGDPDNFLFFHYGVPRPGEGNYNSPELIKVLTDAQKVVDQGQRAELYKQAAVIIHEDCPRLFIGHNQVPLLFSKKVSGYVLNPTSTEIYNTVILLP